MLLLHSRHWFLSQVRTNTHCIPAVTVRTDSDVSFTGHKTRRCVHNQRQGNDRNQTRPLGSAKTIRVLTAGIHWGALEGRELWTLSCASNNVCIPRDFHKIKVHFTQVYGGGVKTGFRLRTKACLLLFLFFV